MYRHLFGVARIHRLKTGATDFATHEGWRYTLHTSDTSYREAWYTG